MSASVKSNIPDGEIAKLVDTLIDNHQIKDILMKSMCTFFWKQTNNTHNNTGIEQGLTV